MAFSSKRCVNVFSKVADCHMVWNAGCSSKLGQQRVLLVLVIVVQVRTSSYEYLGPLETEMEGGG